MEIKASLRYKRIAPRKSRLIPNLIRGKEVDEVKKELSFSPKRAALPFLKLLDSALANAKNNFEVKGEELKDFYIKKIIIDEGPTLKRWRPVAKGSAHAIQKKTGHITLILDKKKPKSKNKKSKSKK